MNAPGGGGILSGVYHIRTTALASDFVKSVDHTFVVQPGVSNGRRTYNGCLLDSNFRTLNHPRWIASSKSSAIQAHVHGRADPSCLFTVISKP